MDEILQQIDDAIASRTDKRELLNWLRQLLCELDCRRAALFEEVEAEETAQLKPV